MANDPQESPKPVVPEKPKVSKHTKGGRKTASDDELWKRRFNGMRLRALGHSVEEIAASYGVSSVIIREDFKAYKMVAFEYTEIGLERIIIAYDEVIKKALASAKDAKDGNAKVGYYKVIIEANRELSILGGLRKVDVNGTINNLHLNQDNRKVSVSVGEKIKMPPEQLKRLADKIADEYADFSG